MGGVTLDSPELFSIYEKMSKLGLSILVHPTFPLKNEFRRYEKDFALDYLCGWPYETLAFSRITSSDVFDRFPNLVFMSFHLGGMLSFYLERMRELYS